MDFYTTSRGFTIMDVLISAAIVSLLSSVFLFQTTEAKKKAEDAQMKAEAHEVSNAVALYRSENNGQVPVSVSSEPGVRYEESDPEYEENMQELVSAGYLAEVPRSPSGSSYSYLVSDDGSSAVFGVRLNSSKSGSTNKNSCELQDESQVIGACRTEVKRTFQAMQWTYKTCSDFDYDSDNEICFLDTRSIFTGSCNCNTTTQYADEGYPDVICTDIYMGTKNSMGELNWNHLFGTRTDVSCPEVEPYAGFYIDNFAYICELESNSVCNGTSDSDYCECI